LPVYAALQQGNYRGGNGTILVARG
jgi:hypothetical protein